jgi:hypothetical protein
MFYSRRDPRIRGGQLSSARSGPGDHDRREVLGYESSSSKGPVSALDFEPDLTIPWPRAGGKVCFVRSDLARFLIASGG